MRIRPRPRSLILTTRSSRAPPCSISRKGLYRRGFFPTRVIVKGLWLQAYFRMVGREKPGHIEDVRSVTLGFIEGHTVTELTEIAKRGLRGVDRRPHLAGYQGARSDASRRRAAGLAGDGRSGRGCGHHRRANGTDRRAGYDGRTRRWRLHRTATAAICSTARPKRKPYGRWHVSMDLILPTASRTPTPTTTCRCCRWSGTRARVNPDRRLPAHAEEQDWQIQDYRSGRKAARLGLLGAGAAGATAGAVATGFAVRRIFKG